MGYPATSVTWTSPSPAWTPKDHNDIRTFVMPVLNGSTQVALRWRYTLSAGSVLLITFSLRLNDGSFDDIGTTFTGVFNTKDYRARFNISRSELATLIINKVTEREETVYQCKVTTDSGPSSYRIQVIVTVPVKLIHVSGDQTVLEGSNTTLFCEGTGKPTPNITLTRVLKDGSDGETLPQRLTYNFPNINRSASGTYCCKAENEYETISQVFEVIVIYPAKIVKLVSEHELTPQQSVSLDCQAEGNPLPTYSWTPCGTTCDAQQIKCNERLLIFQDRDKSVYTLTCKVTNNLGSDTRNTTLFIASDVINVTLVITSEECTDGEYSQLWERLKKTIDEIFAAKLGYESVQQKNIRSCQDR